MARQCVKIAGRDCKWRTDEGAHHRIYSDWTREAVFEAIRRRRCFAAELAIDHTDADLDRA
jgi:hypothetical protein